ncbi:hypothetical protein GCM10007967_27420 [Xylanimonas ulmi]
MGLVDADGARGRPADRHGAPVRAVTTAVTAPWTEPVTAANHRVKLPFTCRFTPDG